MKTITQETPKQHLFFYFSVHSWDVDMKNIFELPNSAPPPGGRSLYHIQYQTGNFLHRWPLYFTELIERMA